MVENIAYKEQQASRLGVVINLYMQQSLGNFVEFIQSEEFDKEKFVQQVKEIFAMSTKSLDLVSRADAFHHIIRRPVSMSDSGLYQLDDSNNFANLSLSGEGVLGSWLEFLLKSRKQKKKQLDVMLPEPKKKS